MMTRNSRYNSGYKYFRPIYATLSRLAIHDSMRRHAIIKNIYIYNCTYSSEHILTHSGNSRYNSCQLDSAFYPPLTPATILALGGLPKSNSHLIQTSHIKLTAKRLSVTVLFEDT